MQLPKKKLMMLISLLVTVIIPIERIMGMLLDYLILTTPEHQIILMGQATVIETLWKKL
jgi:hypothetical protein